MKHMSQRPHAVTTSSSDDAEQDGSEEKIAPLLADRARGKLEPIFKGAIEVCPFGIVIVDPLGKIILANVRTERMFGYARDELIGETVDSLIPIKLRGRDSHHRSKFALHSQLRMIKNRRLFGLRKDGTKFPIEFGLNTIEGNDETLILATIVDISERLRVEHLKDEFVATVSHELRTPLTSISGALGLLVNNAGGTLPTPAIRLLKIAHANSQRLVRLVNNILDMEKIESGKVVFALKRVEIRALVQQAIEATRAFADGFSVRLRLDAASVAAEMRVDPDWLIQVVTNLLSNAVKFSPPGEDVVVAVERRGKKIRISVRDHGHGIPDEFRPRIFEKFAQADASDTRQQGGTGLGLSIVKQIVTRLGGEVGFDDAPGGGTIFHVDLDGTGNTVDKRQAGEADSPLITDDGDTLNAATKSPDRRATGHP